MRIAAAVILAGLCAWAGYSKSCAMAKRERLMETFIGDMLTLSMEIEYRPRELEAIAGRLGAGGLGQFWKDFIVLLPQRGNGEAAWIGAVERYEPFEVLSIQEKNAVIEAGRGLGASSGAQQIKNSRRTIAECERLLENIRAERERKGGMYTKLGILSGMALALIIL